MFQVLYLRSSKGLTAGTNGTPHVGRRICRASLQSISMLLLITQQHSGCIHNNWPVSNIILFPLASDWE
ncbi:hypothetical protein CapIbe_021704 [Capra ibex]